MTLFHDDGQARFYLGDCREVMRQLEPDSVDAIVTDPPYGLGFMGKEWDAFTPASDARRRLINDRKGTPRKSEKYPSKLGSLSQGAGVAIEYDMTAAGMRRFQAWCEEWATEALRVAKPGAHLVAFGSPRTYHRLACGIEDAGWEIRDGLQWLFGMGFPKSLNLHGQWEGWGTALKPGYEPIVLARAPFSVRTVKSNVEKHGTGGLNIDGCRIEAPEGSVVAIDHAETGARRGYDGGLKGGSRTEPQSAGRWPANLLLDEDAAEMLDEQAGDRGASGRATGPSREAGTDWKNTLGTFNGTVDPAPFYGDSGGPSRFYYTSKASRTEREMYLEDLPEVKRGDGRRTEIENPRLRTSRRRNHHPTVKPIDLMRWIVRLVTPPGGLILDPFLGSGTTAVAAKAEGFRCVGIEMEAEYLEIARRRCMQQGLIPTEAVS